MSINLFGKHESNVAANNNTLSAKEKRERLLKIEQKLEAITIHKQNQVKDETEEELTRRVLEI
jgi:uncharacterized membrane protein YukC